jgi:hypothetical protein
VVGAGARRPRNRIAGDMQAVIGRSIVRLRAP